MRGEVSRADGGSNDVIAPDSIETPGKFAKKRDDFKRFVNLVREDYRSRYRDWTLPGFRALAVYRFGVWVKSVGHPRLLHWFLFRIYRVLFLYVRNQYGIELPETSTVGRRLLIAHQGGIVIHYLSQIGDDCLIHQNVTLGAATDETIELCPILGNRVEVGAGAALIGAVVIGDDVRIGPNAVVTMNVPTGSTVVATAPRVIQLAKRSGVSAT